MPTLNHLPNQNPPRRCRLQRRLASADIQLRHRRADGRLGIGSRNGEASYNSMFTLELHLYDLHEVKLDANVEMSTQMIDQDSKRPHFYQSLHLVGEDKALSGNDKMLLHVYLSRPRSASFSAEFLSKLKAIFA